MYKFIKEKNKFTWQNNDIKLVFSDPRITAFHENVPIESEKSIMYYYYTVQIYKRITIDYDDDDNEIKRWRLVTSRSTHDFPCIFQLRTILQEILKANTKECGQKHTYSSGKITYSLTYETEGFICDDFYSITKEADTKGKTEKYIVYLGTTFDNQGDLNSVGIRTPYANRDDIIELLKTVQEFISYSIITYNDSVLYFNRLSKEQFFIEDGKLYQYLIVYDDYKAYVDKDKIDVIYTVGDNCWGISTLKEGENLYEVKEYEKGKIIDIKENEIVFEIFGENIVIQLEDLLKLYDEIKEEFLSYDIEDIANHMLSILNDKEKTEFKQKELNFIKDKYTEAIINRATMCRDEHPYHILLSDGESDNVEIARKAAILVIKEIKNKLLN